MQGGSGRPRILIVGGEPIAREIQAQFLRMAGYEVELAVTGERALLILRELPRRIDWLFTATALPGLVDGWVLADEFHRTHPARPVLLASDASNPTLARGPMLVLENAASPAELVAELHRLTGRADQAPATESTVPPLVTRAAAI